MLVICERAVNCCQGDHTPIWCRHREPHEKVVWDDYDSPALTVDGPDCTYTGLCDEETIVRCVEVEILEKKKLDFEIEDLFLL